MRELANRSYFHACLAFGRVLRSGRYSKTEIIFHRGERQVRKRRTFYAPLLVRLGEPLMKLLDTRVRVLRQREWEERERDLYHRLYGSAIRVDPVGTLILPVLPGETLAALLENPDTDETSAKSAITLAVEALAGLHRLGITHGDAMAENVMVDLDGDAAHWFDFETVHDARCPMAWRHADDLRALLATCLVRTGPDKRAGRLHLVLDAYHDEEVTRLLSMSFIPIVQRPLTFHLGQAPLSFESFRETGRLLRKRVEIQGISQQS